MNMNIMKTHPNAVIPKYAKPGDAGMDVTAVSKIISDDYVEYELGIALEIPEGYVGLLFPRSSVTKTSLIMKNSIGVIDSGYRGAITARFFNTKVGSMYLPGDRVAQLVILPIAQVEFNEVTKLTTSQRGTGGYGSTGL